MDGAVVVAGSYYGSTWRQGMGGLGGTWAEIVLYGFGWSRHLGRVIVNVMQSGGHKNRLHLRVYGRVQGVGFRCACHSQARALGLVGWVRNLPDDSVEIVAEGPSAALDAFQAWSGKGPIFARVDRVVNTPEPPLGTYRSFEIQDDWGE